MASWFRMTILELSINIPADIQLIPRLIHILEMHILKLEIRARIGIIAIQYSRIGEYRIDCSHIFEINPSHIDTWLSRTSYKIHKTSISLSIRFLLLLWSNINR